jgi:aminocarboxymuconate-semialdehyde decarboxylase
VAYGDRETAPIRADLGDIGARLAWMDGAGVDVQVLAGWIDLTGYEIDAALADDYCRAHNDLLAEHGAAAPDRFWTIGTVPLQAPELAAGELAKLMAGGFKGVEIATSVRGRPLDLAGLDPVWEVAEDTGAFVLLHPMTPLAGIDLGRYLLENSIGRPAETSIALAGLIMSGVFERFPALRLCAVHGGGFTPFQIGRLDRSFHARPDVAAARISKPPSEYLRQLYLDTVVHDPATLRFLVDLVGADHLVLGSDYPFEMGDTDPLRTIASVPGITAAEIESISGATMHAICGGGADHGP